MIKYLYGLEEFGVIAIGVRGMGVDNHNIFKEIEDIANIKEKIDDMYRYSVPMINGYVENCKFRNVLFKDACIGITIEWTIELFKESKVLRGKFVDEVKLYDNSRIINGTYSNRIELHHNSYIRGGVFYDVVIASDNSVINGGVFYNNVVLHDNACIKNGIFMNNIISVKSDDAKIINGEFDEVCEVFLPKKHEKETLNLLKEKNVRYYIH